MQSCFPKYVKVTSDNSVILRLDYHSSYLSTDAIRFAKKNGQNLLTFPNCSYRMQPLD